MIVLYALWTLACHFTIWRDGNLYDLYFNFGVVLATGVIGAAFFLIYRRQRAAASRPARTETSPPVNDRQLSGEPASVNNQGAPAAAAEKASDASEADADDANSRRFTSPAVVAGVVAFALGIALWQRFAPNIVAFWWVAVIALAGGYVYSVRRERDRTGPPLESGWMHAGVWLLALFGGFIALIAHRPDLDDAAYVNMAAAIIDEPQAAMLAQDEMHGVEGAPLMLPVYRVHSFEILNAAIGHVLGWSANHAFHWVAAPLWAFFIPLAIAYLFRLLTPRLWFWNTLTAVIVLLASGDSNWGYANFGFVKSWHGKSVLIVTLVPLLSALAIRFMREPRPGRWALLFLANITAVGFSSSAVWVAPVVTGLSLLSAARWSWRSLALTALGTAATLYTLGVGLALKPMLANISRYIVEKEIIYVSAYSRPIAEAGEPVQIAIRETTGRDLNYFAGLVAIACAWAFCSTGAARRYCALVPLGVLVVILNPYWDQWAMANITGNSYSRALWAIPIPLLIAIILTSPLQLKVPRNRRFAPAIIYTLLVIAYANQVPSMSVLSERNRTFFALPPELKIEPEVHTAAQELMEAVPPGSRVIVPWQLAASLPTYQNRLYPLSVRDFYTMTIVGQVGVEDMHLRREVTDYTAGFIKDEGTPEAFRNALNIHNVKAVAISQKEHGFYSSKYWDVEQWREEITGILRDEGFAAIPSATHYEIWVRQPL